MLENIPDWLTVTGGIITVVTALIGLTVYFTRLRLEGNRQLRSCDLELKEKRSTIAALEASVHGLTQQVSLLRKGREDAFDFLNEINNLLREVSDITGATSDSILVPNPYSETTLVFLVAHGEAADKIKKMKVPISDSVAGTVFRSGRVSIFPQHEPVHTEHYEKTDKKSGYYSDSILTMPLQAGGDTVGVVQILNKRDGTPFSRSDCANVEHQCTLLANHVRKLASDPNSLKALGVAELPDDVTASVLFADITQSSSLFKDLSAEEALDLLNEYFDRLGSVALRHRATIDKFVGDGIMLRFNVPRQINDFAAAAVQCAVAMQNEFSLMRKEWLQVGYPVDAVRHRIGIATGPVVGGLMGHPQYLSYTVMGESVNRSAHLCEEARQSRTGILVCKTTFEMAREVVGESIGFAKRDSSDGSEVHEVRALAS